MNNVVHVIMKHSGQYDNRTTQMVCSFVDRRDAVIYKQKLDQLASKLAEIYEGFNQHMSDWLEQRDRQQQVDYWQVVSDYANKFTNDPFVIQQFVAVCHNDQLDTVRYEIEPLVIVSPTDEHQVVEPTEDNVELFKSIYLQWGLKGVGFGQLYFYVQDDVLICDNEGMSRDTVKKILCNMVDQAKFNDN